MIHLRIVGIALALAVTGCVNETYFTPVCAPDVREAAAAIHGGATTTALRDSAGKQHRVGAADQVQAEGHWTLRTLGAACATESGRICPTDAVPQTPLYLLETRSVASDETKRGFITAGGLMLAGGIVVGEVGCFRSWCSQDAKTALIVTDVVVGAVAGAALFYLALQVAMGLAN